MPSTPNARAISGSGFWTFLNCMTEVREMTFTPWIFAKSVIKASVIPSAKYSCCGSPVRFDKGRTASDRIAGSAGRPISRRRSPPTS